MKEVYMWLFMNLLWGTFYLFRELKAPPDYQVLKDLKELG